MGKARVSPEVRLWSPLSRDAGQGCGGDGQGGHKCPKPLKEGFSLVKSLKIGVMKALKEPWPLYIWETETLGGAETDPRSPRGDVAKQDLNSAMFVLRPVRATG